MTLLRESPDDLFALIPLAADREGIGNSAFVEKEYWALEALRSLQAPLDIDATPLVVFKGGTSLSRGLHLTRRFSDDIDVMLNYTGSLGPRARDRDILKPLIERAASDLGSVSRSMEATTGRKRNARLSYPTRFGPGSHSEGILIEMALREAPSLLPGTLKVSIQSYVGGYLDSIGENTFEDTQPFQALVLSPVRTLLEKLSLLHGKAAAWSAAGVQPSDVGRHYYDVHRLLSDPTVASDLLGLSRDEFAEICDAMDAATRQMRIEPPTRPTGGYAESLAFSPTPPYSRVLEAEFGAAEGLLYDEMPSVDECCELVGRFADHLIVPTVAS